MPVKVVWTAQIQCSVFTVWREACSILSVPPQKNSCLRADTSRNSERVGVGRAQTMASGVSDELAIIREVRSYFAAQRLKTNIASLNSTRCFTGNQCKRDMTDIGITYDLIPPSIPGSSLLMKRNPSQWLNTVRVGLRWLHSTGLQMTIVEYHTS